MLAKPHVESTIIAGESLSKAKNAYRRHIRESGGRTMFGDKRYKLLAIRIRPPLKCAVTYYVPERYGALVTWVPIRACK